ncbi:MAG: Hpt domain-containing protein [Alphaproteobacteria bacterium]|nr:Hpt domain-containing protein [Alphaproteobacteria bacterium]
MADPAVDLAHLARYTGGDDSLNAEVLGLFDSQAEDLVLQLRSILKARDAKSWKLVTHTLKGAARGIGAFDLADAAASAEAVDPADEARALPALSVLTENADKVRDFIRSYLG